MKDLKNSPLDDDEQARTHCMTGATSYACASQTEIIRCLEASAADGELLMRVSVIVAAVTSALL